MSTTTTTLTFNGINGATGDYLLPPMTPQQISRIAQGETLDAELRKDLEVRHFLESQKTMRIAAGRDTGNLAEAGWGIIFAHNADPGVREALGELLEHRRDQAAAVREERYREYLGEHGYWPGETAYGFLGRFGAGPGPANPDKVPYYLLIVGDPEAIPYAFQYQLDVERAVGRIHFDTLEEYAQYARSVVQAETSVQRPRRAVFFGVRNPDDPATTMSDAHLVTPLAQALDASQGDWTIEHIRDDDASKARLQRLMGKDETPALLFTASHGMGFPPEDPRLLPHQGALLCQDWPGPKQHRSEIPQDFYMAADDIDDDAHLLGMIGFHFACYGAGSPHLDDFAHHSFQDVAPIAPHAFVSKLPQRLLGHPKGGALAFVGHIERAWGYSFEWPGAGPQTDVFESTLHELMSGVPVGAALEYFNSRYAEISTILTAEQDAIKQTNKIPNDLHMASVWISNNDARGYAIIGDPAVRLPVGDGQNGETATEIEPVTVITTSSSPADAIGRSSQPGVPMDATPYGLFRGDDALLRDLPARIANALEEMTTSVSKSIQDMFHDATSIHVETYVSDNLTEVTYDREARRMAGPARLRAVSHISADSDTFVCIAEDADADDKTMWDVHGEAVRQAQAYRAEMLKAAISTASSFLGSGKTE